MSVGDYLETKCFNEATINEVVKITRCYIHDTGRVSVSVDKFKQLQNVRKISVY